MPSKQTHPYTLPNIIQTNISEVLDIYRSSVVSQLNGHTFAFDGIYESSGNVAYHNDSYYYDKVIDKETGKLLKLFLHKKFKKLLKNREPYRFTGTLQLVKEARNSSIGVYI